MRPLSEIDAARVATGHRVEVMHVDAHRGERVARIVGVSARRTPAAGAARLRSARCGPSADRCGGSRRPSVCRATSAMAPAISTPVAPPPTMTKVSSAPPLVVIGDQLGLLESGQDAAADAGRVLDALESRRKAGPVVMAEIGMHGAGRDHQISRRRNRPDLVVSSCLPRIDRRHLCPSSTVALRWSRRMCRIGQATSAGDSAAVAT